jgi:putative ABC transport system permease protein
MIGMFQYFREIKFYKGLFLSQVLILFISVFGFAIIDMCSKGADKYFVDEQRSLLAADLMISAKRKLSDSEISKANELLSTNIVETSVLRETYSMLYSGKTTTSRLAELRFVESDYPFYGKIQNEESIISFSDEKFLENGIYLNSDLANQLGVNINDRVAAGNLNLIVQGIFTKDSSQSFRGFALAPRVYIHVNNAEKSGLFTFGSVATEAILYKLQTIKTVNTTEIKKIFTDPTLKVATSAEAGLESAKNISQINDYLFLVQLIAGILSLLSFNFLLETYLTQRKPDFDKMKLLGVSNSQITKIVIFWVFSCLVLVFGLSSLILPKLAMSLSALILKLTSVQINLNFSIIDTLKLFLGYIIISFMVMWALLNNKYKKWIYFSFILLFGVLSVYFSKSYKMGSIFFLSVTILSLIVMGLIKIALILTEKGIQKLRALSIFNSLSLGLAFRQLVRERKMTMLSFFCAFMSTTLLVFIFSLKQSLESELVGSDSKKPDLFLFDIQDTQKDEFLNVTNDLDLNMSSLTPMIRAKIKTVNGEVYKRKTVNSIFSTREEDASVRFRERMVNLSFSKELKSSENLVAGKFWTKDQESSDVMPECSLEQSYATRMGFKMGDILEFDISSIPFKTRVTSLRRVKWTSFEPNFFINIQPGLINEAPHTFLVSLYLPKHISKNLVQKRLIEKMPTVSSIDLSMLLDKLVSILEKLTWVLQSFSLFSLALSFVLLIILSYLEAETKSEEFRLKVLMGFSKNKLVQESAFKDLYLMFAATLSGLLAGISLTWILCSFLFDIYFEVLPLKIALVCFALFLILFIIKFLFNLTIVMRHTNISFADNR